MSQTPVWIEALVDIVSECIEPHTFMGPLGFRYREDAAISEISVYPCPIELMGGSEDAEIVSPLFSLNLQPLWTAFEDRVEFRWHAHSVGPHDYGAYIAVEGRYEGHDVWLQILAEAPDDEEPAMKVDLAELAVDDSATRH